MIQLLQITPEELADLIREQLKPELAELVRLQNEKQAQGKEFLTRHETCDFFQISKVTLHDWMKKGIIHPYKMGNRTYFRYAELLERLIESNRRD